ncbi:MAG: glycosyltransferase, group 1 family [Parcubacteria group bacterium Greene0714_7]|nr:MAG: glycosyltransferase, group 1 family [Parcubacteria group bacterium Greene0714_7]
MKKKILFIITKSNWGGAQRYVYDLALALPKDQFDVSVAFGAEGLLAKKLRENQIKIFPIQSLQRDISVGNDIKSFFELLHVFGAEKPDIVHLNSSKAGGVGVLAARLAGIRRIIFTAHGWPFWEQRNSLSRALIYLFSWLTALLSHKVIVISNYDLRVAKKMPFVGHKTVRIYNGIDLNVLLGSGKAIRDEFLPGTRITGTIGELNKNKNQIALIEEAKNNPNMHVVIVGDGENREFLNKKIKEYNLNARVRLIGFRPASEVLKGFDVFALPSIKEGLPYVLLEARMAGLPIVANLVGGVTEILDAKDMSEFSLKEMVQKTIAVYEPMPTTS